MTAVFLVAISVGIDNFAVAAAFGMTSAGPAGRLQVALAFGLFAGGMPLLGLLIGSRISGAMGSVAAPAGACLLIATGGYSLFAALRDRRKRGAAAPAATVGPDPDSARPAWQGRQTTRVWLAAPVLSLDSLVVGLALGAYRVPLPLAVITFAAVGTGLSLLGLEIGRRVGVLLGELGGLVSGLALIGVGVALGLGLG